MLNICKLLYILVVYLLKSIFWAVAFKRFDGKIVMIICAVRIAEIVEVIEVTEHFHRLERSAGQCPV
jgi:hypothetical protein